MESAIPTARATATSVEFAAAVSTSYKAAAFVAPALKASPRVRSALVASAPVAATFATPAFMAPATSPEFGRTPPVVPRTGSNKEAAHKVVGPVEPIRRASVRIIVVVAVRADGRPTRIDRPSDAHSNSNLRLRISHRQHQHREQRKIFHVTHTHLQPDPEPFAQVPEPPQGLWPARSFQPLSTAGHCPYLLERGWGRKVAAPGVVDFSHPA